LPIGRRNVNGGSLIVTARKLRNRSVLFLSFRLRTEMNVKSLKQIWIPVSLYLKTLSGADFKPEKLFIRLINMKPLKGMGWIYAGWMLPALKKMKRLSLCSLK